MASTKWSRDEERILRTYYQRHGARWDGWAMLLPGRSEASITNKAKKMCVKVGVAQPTRAVVPDDAQVMRLFRKGMAPSAIDAMLGAEPGTARGIVVYQWAMEKDRFYGYDA